MRIRLLLLTFVITACRASNGGTRPRDMTAAEHLTEAAVHGTKAAQSGGPYASSPYYWNHPYTPGQGWYPWYYWDPIAEHQRLAATHTSAAEAVKLEHQAACATIPELTQSLSPFDVHAVGRTPDGVILHLAPEAGPPDVLLVLLRCHRAWLRLARRAGDPDDLIAVDGAKVVVHAGGRTTIEVMFSTKDPAALAELERRAHVAVQRAKQRREAAKSTPVTGQPAL